MSYDNPVHVVDDSGSKSEPQKVLCDLGVYNPEKDIYNLLYSYDSSDSSSYYYKQDGKPLLTIVREKMNIQYGCSVIRIENDVYRVNWMPEKLIKVNGKWYIYNDDVRKEKEYYELPMIA